MAASEEEKKQRKEKAFQTDGGGGGGAEGAIYEAICIPGLGGLLLAEGKGVVSPIFPSVL